VGEFGQLYESAENVQAKGFERTFAFAPGVVLACRR
jgi:hypothetical protein